MAPHLPPEMPLIQLPRRHVFDVTTVGDLVIAMCDNMEMGDNMTWGRVTRILRQHGHTGMFHVG